MKFILLLAYAWLFGVFAGACAESLPTKLPTADQPRAAEVLSTELSSTVAPPIVPVLVYRETGTASWYGREFHGRPTASGETFDMYGLSAAHRTIPLGTLIRVTNLNNSKSITARVNDRGPFVSSRVIELSFGAAREIGFASQGTAPVKIETFGTASNSGVFTVQAAMFSEEENARLLKEKLSQRYEMVTIIPFQSNIGRFFRILVGNYQTEEKAERIAAKLTLEGLEPVVLRKD